MRAFFSAVLAVLLTLSPALAQEKVSARVTFASLPAGAEVVVDGKSRGVTPLTLYDLASGRHHARFRLAGYESEDRFFDTAEGPAVQCSADLRPVKALLLVKTDPPGATVIIDGTARGLTPRLISDLDAKDPCQLRLRKAGYVDQVLSLKFAGREPKVVDEKLVLDAGVIQVLSDPVGAAVTVNGIPRGLTPTLVKGISKGRATVKLALDGYDDEVRELALRAGDNQTLSVALKPKPGTLHLISVPEGARFYLNDEARGVGPLVIPGLKPGEYTVRAERAGYATVSRTVRIQNGQSAREEFKLSNVMGRLEVRTDPVGAQVVLDGHLLGTTRAKGKDAEYSDVYPVENLLEGEHVLTIRKEGYAEVVRHPKVAQSQTVKANVRLKRIFVPDVEIVTVRGTTVGVLVSNSPDAVVVEVALGINRSIPREEIRKINFLKNAK